MMDKLLILSLMFLLFMGNVIENKGEARKYGRSEIFTRSEGETEEEFIDFVLLYTQNKESHRGVAEFRLKAKFIGNIEGVLEIKGKPEIAWFTDPGGRIFKAFVCWWKKDNGNKAG